ncbi:HAD family hydrolase [Variovorax sp. M-6]|uniref:HAD family hydrolase n=1 Tax=Variovorax sp. M-6 TaxID=3233041 RepID=UPI003F9E49ED
MNPKRLSSWNDCASRTAIVDFVERTTRSGSSDFVPPADRVATFDNDGTLWCERPLQVQFFFARSRLEQLAQADPSLRTRDPFKTFLEHDMRKIPPFGMEDLMHLAATVHSGTTVDEFGRIAQQWLAAARHPTLGRLFTALTYQPQIELLHYLHENGFKTFVVSGGGIDLMRACSETLYGVARDQVIGSSMKTRFEMRDGRGELVKLAEMESFNDREVKVNSISRHVGRRPILAFGNSDGDLAMLRYTRTGEGPRLALLLHHDDAEREFAYDREFALSPLAEALDHADAYGLQVVSMKRDWAQVFAA